MNTVVKTRRLTLRAMQEKDTENILDLLTNAEIARNYMLPDYEKREDALPLAQRMIALSCDDSRIVTGIDLDGQIIGWINETGKENGSVELGYIIHPAHHNCGYCSEALAALIGQLFEMGYDRVFCGAFEENPASLRVMEKCGMTPMTLTEELEYRGKVHTILYREILKTK